MLYDYECESCEYRMIDVYQSIKDQSLTQCPRCGKHSLQRIIHGGLGHFVKEVKTIGQLADKNWSNLGAYKRSEIQGQSKATSNQDQSPFSSCGNATKKEIHTMTPEQKKKYIMEGKK